MSASVLTLTFHFKELSSSSFLSNKCCAQNHALYFKSITADSASEQVLPLVSQSRSNRKSHFRL